MILASNPTLTQTQIDRIRAQRGLDRPILQRYGCWLVGRSEHLCRWWPGGRGLLRGDLGFSRLFGRRVGPLVLQRLGRTTFLMFPALALGFVLAWTAGIAAQRLERRWLDQAVSFLGLIGLATPLHWLGMLAVYVFALGLGWFPSSAIEDPAAPGVLSQLHHAALPVGVTALFFAGRWLRHVRAAIAEASGAPFVLALRARGVPEGPISWCIARNALPPVLVVVGHSIPIAFSGAVVIERVFVYPGMGSLLIDSVAADDYLVAIVVLLLYSTVTLLAALVADLALYLLDPRLRASGTLG